MKTIFLLFLISLTLTAHGQADSVLEQYLVKHRATIRVNPDSSFTLSPEAGTMVRSCMKGKSLFVLAENTSHEMDLYGYLRPALMEQLMPIHLKYVFMERGRSVAYCMNAWLDNDYKMSDDVFYDSTERECVKHIMGSKRTFTYVGLDFERGIQFNLAVNNLLYDVDTNALQGSRAFIARIRDMRNVQIPEDGNAITYYRNMHRFYAEVQKEFYKDSAVIRQELGDKYNELRYLLSNANNQLPPPLTKPRYISRQRNPELARNLLAEMTPLDTTATYFLSIGLEHAQLSRGMMIPKVARTNLLKNRVVKMNEYCENCIVEGEEAYSLEMQFMKGEVREAFSKAADNDLTIFDLSQLPDEYKFIKRHGELLLFAKNQH